MTADRRRWRGWVSALLVALTCVALIAAVIGTWTRRNFLDTDRFVERMDTIADDPAIQEAVSLRVTTEVMRIVDPQALFEEVLPERGQLLARPLTNAVRNFVGDSVASIVASDRFEQLWLTAVRAAHTVGVRLLRESAEITEVEDGEARLDLLPVVNAVLQDLGERAPEVLGDVEVPTLTDENRADVVAALNRAFDLDLGDDFGTVAVYNDRELVGAQRIVAAIDRSTIALVSLAIILAVAAFWLSQDRRRTGLQLVLGVAIGMVVLRRAAFALEAEVANVPPTEVGGAAASAVVGVVMGPLTTFAAWAAAVCVVAALIVFLAGPSPRASARRHRVGDWVTGHRDVVRIVPVGVGLVLLWAGALSWVGTAVVIIGVVAVEAALGRLDAEHIDAGPAVG